MGNKRFLTISLCVLLAILMFIPNIGSSVKASTLQVQNVNKLDIQATNNSGTVLVDFADIIEKINSNEQISGSINNKSFSFILKEGDMGLNNITCMGVDGKIDEKATQEARSTRVFVGTNLKGTEELTAVMTDRWISIQLVIDGVTYCVDDQPLVSATVTYHLTNNLMYDSNMSFGNDVIAPTYNSNQNISALENISNCYSTNENSCVMNQTLGMSCEYYESNNSESSQPLSESNENSPNQIMDPRNNSQMQESTTQLATTSTITTYQASIIMACDQEFRNTYSDWASQILVPLWEINVEYTNQVSINFLPTLIIPIPSGSCTSTNVDTLLNQFASYMYSHWPSATYPRDLAHLSSGKWLDNGALGKSFEPGVNAERWNSVLNDYGVSYEGSIFSYQNKQVLGHEIGHNFNGDHNYAKDSAHSGWLKDSWMYPTYRGTLSSTTFTAENAQRIRSWAQQTIDTFRTINSGPSSISPENLQSSNLCVIADPIYRVGYPMQVSFQLKNTGSTTITLTYVFTAALDSNNNNRDFGYVNNVVITPGSTFSYNVAYTPQYSGTWTLWPAYKYNGNYGPFLWMTITPSFYFQLGSWSGVDRRTDYNYWTLFYRFNLYSLASSPTAGSTIWTRFSIFDGTYGSSSDHLNYIFVGCRCGVTSKDFGYSGGVDMTQVGAGGMAGGGGYLLWASRTLDSQGTWQFWPCYQTPGGTYGPYQWHMLTITI